MVIKINQGQERLAFQPPLFPSYAALQLVKFVFYYLPGSCHRDFAEVVKGEGIFQAEEKHNWLFYKLQMISLGQLVRLGQFRIRFRSFLQGASYSYFWYLPKESVSNNLKPFTQAKQFSQTSLHQCRISRSRCLFSSYIRKLLNTGIFCVILESSMRIYNQLCQRSWGPLAR